MKISVRKDALIFFSFVVLFFLVMTIKFFPRAEEKPSFPEGTVIGDIKASYLERNISLNYIYLKYSETNNYTGNLIFIYKTSYMGNYVWNVSLYFAPAKKVFSYCLWNYERSVNCTETEFGKELIGQYPALTI